MHGLCVCLMLCSTCDCDLAHVMVSFGSCIYPHNDVVLVQAVGAGYSACNTCHKRFESTLDGPLHRLCHDCKGNARSRWEEAVREVLERRANHASFLAPYSTDCLYPPKVIRAFLDKPILDPDLEPEQLQHAHQTSVQISDAELSECRARGIDPWVCYGITSEFNYEQRTSTTPSSYYGCYDKAVKLFTCGSENSTKELEDMIIQFRRQQGGRRLTNLFGGGAGDLHSWKHRSFVLYMMIAYRKPARNGTRLIIGEKDWLLHMKGF
jgi:hypothetical protein